jgi:hypothetical protein
VTNLAGFATPPFNSNGCRTIKVVSQLALSHMSYFLTELISVVSSNGSFSYELSLSGVWRGGRGPTMIYKYEGICTIARVRGL